MRITTEGKRGKKTKQKATLGAFLAVWVLGGIARQIKSDAKNQVLDAKTVFQKWSKKKWKKVPKPVRWALFGAGVTARALYRGGRHLDRTVRLGAQHGIAEGRHRHRERQELAEHPKGSTGREHILARVRGERDARWLEHQVYATEVHQHAWRRRTDKTASRPVRPGPPEPEAPKPGRDPLTWIPPTPAAAPAAGQAPASPAESSATAPVDLDALADLDPPVPAATATQPQRDDVEGVAAADPHTNGVTNGAGRRGTRTQLPCPAKATGNGGPQHHNNGGKTVATDVESPTISSVETSYDGAQQHMLTVSEQETSYAATAMSAAEEQAAEAEYLKGELAALQEKAALMESAGHDRDTVRELHATAESYQARVKEVEQAAEAWQTVASLSGTASAGAAETASLCQAHRQGLSRTNAVREGAGSLNGATASLGAYRE